MTRHHVSNHLGQLIALAREFKGWTLRDLDKRSGVGHSVISQIETGYIKEPSFRVVVKLSKALGLKLDRVAKAAVQDNL